MSLQKHRKAIFSWMAAGAIITLLGTSLVVAGKPAPALYTMTDLGGFGGKAFPQSEAKAVSNVQGGLLTIVGNSYTAIPHEADPAEWTVDAAGHLVSVVDLGTPGTSVFASAFDVNDDGVRVGSVLQDATGAAFPGFVSLPGVGIILLPTFGGLDSAGNGINNSGEIVGYADDAEGNTWGALWHIDNLGNVSGPMNLGTFIPAAINDAGEMAGSQAGDAAIASFDVKNNLHTQSLGVLSPTDVGSYASAINARGEVVGTSISPGSTSGTVLPHAFFWRSGIMISLGDLGGGTSSASSINDSSQVVGSSSDRHGATAPFLWQNGKLSNLNTLAGLGSNVTAVTATGINNSGHIVGLGSVAVSRKSSQLHGYLLTPKP